MPFDAAPTCETRIPIADAEDVLVARQKTRDTARCLGFGAVDQARVARIAGELARNALLYAGAGECRIRAQGVEGAARITLELEDAGPGIPDVPAALAPGFSSDCGGGKGLPIVKKLACALTIESRPGRTLVTARFERRRGIDFCRDCIKDGM
jgi:serine/threonine-protein kinase RsbT